MNLVEVFKGKTFKKEPRIKIHREEEPEVKVVNNANQLFIFTPEIEEEHPYSKIMQLIDEGAPFDPDEIIQQTYDHDKYDEIYKTYNTGESYVDNSNNIYYIIEKHDGYVKCYVNRMDYERGISPPSRIFYRDVFLEKMDYKKAGITIYHG